MEKVEDIILSDRMQEKIDENIDSVLQRLDDETLVTPDGTKYINLKAAKRNARCSKTHFYVELLGKNQIRKRHLGGRVYFNEADILQAISNSVKTTKSKVFSEEPLNRRKDEKPNIEGKTTIVWVQSLLKEKEDLREQLSASNIRVEKANGMAMFYLASTIGFALLSICGFYSVQQILDVQRSENRSFSERLDNKELVLAQKIDENAKLQQNLAVLKATTIPKP